MKKPALVLLAILTASGMCFAAADGSWLKKIPQADRERVNPVAGDTNAQTAGKQLFESNCAKCHGKDAEGKGSRPSLKSDRVANAKDGEIAWLLKNGNLYKGMPNWSTLPEQQRWQIIAYLRSLNAVGGTVQK